MYISIDLPPGLNSDDTEFSGKSAWVDGDNVRFVKGKPQTIGGWDRYGSHSLTGTPRSIYAWDIGAEILIAIGTSSKLHVVTGSTLYDITPAEFSGSTTAWALANWGTDLLASEKAGKLFHSSTALGTPATATHVTQAPAVINHMIVTPQRQVLALGCNEEVSGTFNALCIRGSDIEDYTDWTTTTTNNAFEHILEAGGDIIAGAIVSQYVGVWTTDRLYLGQYIGDPGQTYRFDPVAEKCGLLGPSALTVVDGAAYWVSQDGQFYRWQVGMLPERLACPIWDDFQVGFGRHVYSVLVHNSKYNELWFFYPDSRDGTTENSRYLAVSLDDGSWFRGTLARSAASGSYLLRQATQIGGDVQPTSFLAATSAGALYFHEVSNTADGSALNWHITSADHHLDESRSRVMVRRFIPDFEDQVGDVSLTVFTKDRPQSSQVTNGPYTLTTSTTKSDFRASGKILSMKLSGGAASGSFMRLGKPVFDVVQMGER